MRRILQLFVGATLMLLCATALERAQSQSEPAQQKVIAITIDDVPLNGPRTDIERLRTMTSKLLDGFQLHKIPAVAFVNESLLYVPGEADERIALLRQWANAAELGNHTFAHVGFKDTPLAQYQDDFVRGDAMTRAILKERGTKPRYFRHPYLQMGPTLELEKSFESFIAERGYKIAPVSVGTLDWMILTAYSKARAAGDISAMKRVSDDYLKFVGEQIDYSEKTANELFGRPIKQILLLHANELNADNMDALVKVMTDRGYRFITLEEALSDPAYQYPDKYIPTSDWLSLWSSSKGYKFSPPSPPEYLRKAWEEIQAPRPTSSELTAEQDHKLMMQKLGITSLRPGANPNKPDAPNAANYDEAKANPYPNLPDPMTLKNGKKGKRHEDMVESTTARDR